jgi:hypothetical protein
MPNRGRRRSLRPKAGFPAHLFSSFGSSVRKCSVRAGHARRSRAKCRSGRSVRINRHAKQMVVSRQPSSAIVAKSSDLLAAGIALVVTIAVVLAAFARWRSPTWDFSAQPGGWLGVLLIIALSAIIHELLHVVAWRVLAGIRWQAVSCRATWRGLGLAALLHDPIPVSAFRLAALFPAVALGAVPLGISFTNGSTLGVLWGAFFLFECITDIALLKAVRHLPAATMVISHPTELGCIAVAVQRTK